MVLVASIQDLCIRLLFGILSAKEGFLMLLKSKGEEERYKTSNQQSLCQEHQNQGGVGFSEQV